jgi:hypothetical protein
MIRNFIKAYLLPPEEPFALPAGGWDRFYKEFKEKMPIRYFIYHIIGNNFVDWFRYQTVGNLKDIRYYLKNRYTRKTHTLQGHSLKKGEYHEISERFLDCSFSALVDYIENELPEHDFRWSSDLEKSSKFSLYQVPTWARYYCINWFCIYRSPSAGVDSILSRIKNPTLNTEQQKEAKEIFDLYFWWTVYRPNRPDPYKLAGFDVDNLVDVLGIKDNIKGKSKRKMFNMVSRIEEDYANEDTEMLVRLMKIRDALWT